MNLLNNLQRKKSILKRYVKGAPFARFFDKLSFILGVVIVIASAFIIGRYPNTIFYSY